MDIDAHLRRLEADGPMLADAAGRAGWQAPVPGTQWTVRDLVVHVGGIHRWAADIVRCGHPDGETAAGRAVGSGPPDTELLEWFLAGHGDLLDALRAAPADLRCFTFMAADSPRAFWARRQAHETAIHRADAQAAAGAIPNFDSEFAQDGIAELLLGFAARKNNAIAETGSLVLAPTDGMPPWTVTFGGERIGAVPQPAPSPDATVTGRSAELYLWLWNRPSPVRLSGDQAIAELWRGVRVRWS